MYVKDSYEGKYQYLIKEPHKLVAVMHSNDQRALIENSSAINDNYYSTEEENLGKRQKVLIIFDDMIVDMISDQKTHSVVNELFMRGSKLNISFVFITQTHFPVPKEIRLNISTHLYYEITNRQ